MAMAMAMGQINHTNTNYESEGERRQKQNLENSRTVRDNFGTFSSQSSRNTTLAMAYRTFVVPNTIAWFLGILPLKYPWSNSPTATARLPSRTWTTSYWIYSALLNILNLFLVTSYHTQSKLSQDLVDTHGSVDFQRRFLELVVIALVFSTLLNRFWILYKHQRLIRLYECYQELRYFSKGRMVPLKFIALIGVATLSRAALCVMFSYNIWTHVEYRRIWGLNLPNWVKFGLFAGLGHLPLILTYLAPYVLIILHLCQLVNVHSDFGEELESNFVNVCRSPKLVTVEDMKTKMYDHDSGVVVGLDDEACDCEAKKTDLAKGNWTIASATKISVKSFSLKDQALQAQEEKKWELLKECFAIFDEVFGPLVVSMMFLSLISLVNGLRDLLVFEDVSGFERLYNVLLSIWHLSILCLVEAGFWVHKRMDQKIGAFREVLAKNSGPSVSDICPIVPLYESWSWRFTGNGFFVVDRPLVSSMLNSMLTYIVVLFQMRGGLTLKRE